MNNHRKSLCTVIVLYVLIYISDCNALKRDFIDDSATAMEDSIDPFSWIFTEIKNEDSTTGELAVRKEQKVGRDGGPFIDKIQEPICKNNVQEAIFYKRLVNLLLTNVYIQAQDEAIITGTLNIEASQAQMNILKGFQVEKTSLREIDAIMSDVIKKPNLDYILATKYIFDSLSILFDETFQTMYYHRVIVITVCLMIIACRLIKRLCILQHSAIYTIGMSILILSFFMTWWRLIQEAEIKLTAAQMKYSELPIACQPEKMNMWHKLLFKLFPNDDCEKYYHAIMSNANLQVTPAHVLTHLLSTVILLPIHNAGHIVNSFISNSTGDLPWLYRWIVNIMLYLCVGVVIIVLPFCLCGASLNLGLGPIFKFGIDCTKQPRKDNSLAGPEKREAVQIILQVPHITAPPIVKNAAETQEIKIEAIMPGSDSLKKEPQVEDNCNVCTVEQDLASGDAGCNDGSRNCDLTNRKTEDGSGDS